MIERKTAVITGGASGIGFATVERFSLNPKYTSIYAVDIDPAIEQVFPASKYPNVIPIQIDITNREQRESLIEGAFLESGRLDVVANIAGIMIQGKPSSFHLGKDGKPPEAMRRMFDVNLHAPIYIAWQAAQIMEAQGGGTIINITSSKYLFPDLFHVGYGVTKWELSKTTRRMAKVLMKAYNVRLVDVQPSNTKTNIDRNIWTPGTSTAEMAASQDIAGWWRNTFGNDPRNVADVIYRVAEGDIKSKTIYIGLDTKIGRLLYLLTYPLAGFKSYTLFFGISTLLYETRAAINFLKQKIDQAPAIKLPK